MDPLNLEKAIKLGGEEMRNAIASALLGETTSISALIEQALAGIKTEIDRLDGATITVNATFTIRLK